MFKSVFVKVLSRRFALGSGGAKRRFSLEPLEDRFLMAVAAGGFPPPEAVSVPIAAPMATGSLIPSSGIDVMNLNSKPDSRYSIYLDFDGHVTTNTRWNSDYGVASIVTPRFTLDGDTEKESFTAAERDVIYEVWLRVSEDYMPFDVNVTTVEPSSESFSGGRAQRVAIGGSYSDWFGSAAGGVSYIGSFSASGDLPNFAFSESLYLDPKNIAECISHEVGHTLGLHHKGNSQISGDEEYFRGISGWGPIMGGAYTPELSQWSRGDYEGATNTVDDLRIITTQNGFGYRDDDYADSFDAAAVLSISGGTGEIAGIIERSTDIDAFVFESDGSDLNFYVGGRSGITNLDVLVTLYTEDHQLIRAYDPQDRLDVEFVFTGKPGVYFLTVDGTGRQTDWPGVYSDYGSLGAYTVQVGNPDRLVVTTLADTSGDDAFLSLREAVSLAADRTLILFDASLAGGTIRLTEGEIPLARSLTVDASSVGGITIDAGGESRVFNVSGGNAHNPVKLIGLTVTGGSETNGGGIFSTGALALAGCAVTGNAASGRGGGIHNDNGVLTIANSVVSDNAADIDGGGLYSRGDQTLTNTAVFGNTARWGGGIYIRHGTATLINCTVSGNSAQSAGGGVFWPEGSLSLTNSIVALNYAYNENDIYCEVPDSPLSGSCNIVGFDPHFVVAPVFRWGKLVNLNALDLALAAGSAAIDTGTNDVVETKTDLAGNPRIVGGIVDIGAYEFLSTTALDAPAILTGSGGRYVSGGANRHQIDWTDVENAVGYELAFSSDGGGTWNSVVTDETSAAVGGLAYGADVTYRVRALGAGEFENSEWSASKSFAVCPMDISGDGDISGTDRALLSAVWLAEEGEESYRSYADISGDGDISGTDRAYLSQNWLCEAGDVGLVYPRAAAADAVFAEYTPAAPGADRDVF
ncbi:MAG: hypothetical protein J6S40_06120 [Thermoguttaceae bacterium]|nr:hypothetical protein [Thermoguttaceae bacterium]